MGLRGNWGDHSRCLVVGLVLCVFENRIIKFESRIIN